MAQEVVQEADLEVVQEVDQEQELEAVDLMGSLYPVILNASEDHEEMLDQKDHRVTQVLPEHQEPPELQAHQDQEDQKVKSVTVDTQEHQDQEDHVDLMDHREPPELMVPQALLE